MVYERFRAAGTSRGPQPGTAGRGNAGQGTTAQPLGPPPPSMGRPDGVAGRSLAERRQSLNQGGRGSSQLAVRGWTSLLGQDTCGQAGAERYPSTFLLRATPPPRLLYRPQPQQICQIGKVLAYGTLPASGPSSPRMPIRAASTVVGVNKDIRPYLGARAAERGAACSPAAPAPRMAVRTSAA